MIKINTNNFSKIVKKIISNNSPIKQSKTIKCIKIGIDTNKKSIHIGHYSILRFLKFIKTVKKIIILGTFTALTNTNKKKSNINKINIYKKNSKIIKTKINKIIYIKKNNIFNNFNWLIYNNNNHSNFILKNKIISKVIKASNNKKKININKIIYPYYQSIDSTIIKNTIEIGGFDQINNFKIDYKINKNIYILFPILKKDNNIKISKSTEKIFIVCKNIKIIYLNLIKKKLSILKTIITNLFKIKFYKFKNTKNNHKKNIIASILIEIYSFSKTLKLIKDLKK